MTARRNDALVLWAILIGPYKAVSPLNGRSPACTAGAETSLLFEKKKMLDWTNRGGRWQRAKANCDAEGREREVGLFFPGGRPDHGGRRATNLGACGFGRIHAFPWFVGRTGRDGLGGEPHRGGAASEELRWRSKHPSWRRAWNQIAQPCRRVASGMVATMKRRTSIIGGERRGKRRGRGQR